MGNLIEHIKQGIKNAYHENAVLKTSYKSFHGKIVEYLVTVNIAQQLIKWNAEENHLYSICLEFDVTEFAKNCLSTEIKIIDLWDSELLIPDPDSTKISDSGRLDIAIFKEDNRSYSAIEIKAINQGYVGIFADIERLINLVNIKDNNSDIKNSVDECYSCFIKYIGGSKKISKDSGLKSAATRILKDVRTKIANLIAGTVCKVEVFPFIITKSSLTDISENKLIEEYSEAAEETGLVFGVIIKISR
jgi:hypothetical protein